MLFILFVLFLLSFLAYKLRKRQMTIFERLGIPGPKPNFLFGNAFDIHKHGTNKMFPKWAKEYGPIFGFYLGGQPQIVVSDFDLIRLVLVKDFNLFINRNEIIPGGLHPQSLLRESTVWKQGNDWKQLRSTLSPAFSSSKLNRMEDLMMWSINNMLKQIDDESKSGHELNFASHAEELSFSTSTNCFMGVNLSIRQLTYEAESLLKSVRPQLEKSKLAMAMMLFPSLTFIAYPLRVLWETIRLKMMWSDEGIYLNMVRKIVQARRDAKTRTTDVLQLLMDSVPSTSSSEEIEDNCTSSPVTNGNSKKQLSEDSIIANAFVFILAGFETTSTTLQYIISDLVNHPDVQDELRNELKKQIKIDGGAANLQTFTKVPLLLHAIKESLRMNAPLGPFTTRCAQQQYEYNGMTILKGMGVFINVTSVHQDPQLWSEPEKYKPERFAGEYNKLAFLPFGAGPRNCHGMQFALMELQLALANLILRYRFEPGPSTEKELQKIETSVTLIPKNGVFCKFVKIEQ